MFLILTTAAYLLLGFLVYHAPVALRYDEHNFYPNIHLLNTLHFTPAFLRAMEQQSPGPLYQIIHLFFKPLTLLEITHMRFLQLAFLLIIQLVIMLQKRIEYNAGWLDAWLYVNLGICIPAIWPISGLALTEIPAILMLTVGLLILYWSDRSKYPWFTAGTAGLFVGLAIWGRSPFLMVPIAAVAAVLYGRIRGTPVRASYLVFAATSLVLALPIFIVWGGLQPPKVSQVESSGLVLWHGVLAFAYAAVFVLFIAGDFFWSGLTVKYLKNLLWLWILLLILNLFAFKVDILPMRSVLESVLPEFGVRLMSSVIPSLFMVLTVWFAHQLYVKFYSAEFRLYHFTLLFSFVFILLTCMKIGAQFSSRYTAQTYGIMVLLFYPYMNLSIRQFFFTLMGILLGAVSLQSYYSGS